MTTIGSNAVLSAFILFCRIGGCLMIMPGISSVRIAPRIRLFVSFAMTLAMTPLLVDEVAPKLSQAQPVDMLQIIVAELLIGALIGFLGRIFFAALDMMGNAIAMAIGLSSPLTPAADDNEPAPAVVALISLSATVLLFVSDLHFELMRGLLASYSAWPVSGSFNPRVSLVEIADVLAQSFMLGLRIASPFIVYSLIVNLAIGLAARFAPQIPIYFVTVPAVAAGGLALLYFVCQHMLATFNAAFFGWLASG